MQTIYDLNSEELVGDDWTNTAQEALIVWKDTAMNRANKHDIAAVNTKRLRDLLMFPIIFIASSTTIIIAFSDISHTEVFKYLALVMSGSTAALTALNSHLKPGEKFIMHSNAANEYRGLAREIEYITSLHPKKRPDVEVPFTAITNRFDNIARVAPFLTPKKQKPRSPKFFE